jgi:dTDP-4-amino-4,6-dideoxygalactose transaminase
MRAAGVQTSIHYPPVHLFQVYREKYPGLTLPVTEHVAHREITLPLFSTMTSEQIEWVIDAVRREIMTDGL